MSLSESKSAYKAHSSERPPAPRGALVLRHVHKTFPGHRRPVLYDVSLSCTPGEFVVLVGRSGCGKTTLLHLASGMIVPDSGEITLDGIRVEEPGPERAVVFQDHGLFPWLNALENVEFGLQMAGLSRSESGARARAALDVVQLASASDKLVHELSGGMRQRLAIARALVLDPAILLMDEPFAALDAQTRTNLHVELQDLWCKTNKTILFVTHSVGEAVRLADRVIVLGADPGVIRREFQIELPHPRDFDSPEVSEFVQDIRAEIRTEAARSGEARRGER